jgi:hypothetical protein
MPNLKFSALWAFAGVFVALLAFSISYGCLHSTFSGYKFLVYPGIVATRFFSEEIDFWPKLGILLAGQYFALFITIFVIRKLIRILKKGRNYV